MALLTAQWEQLEKDFYCAREVAKRNMALIERRCQDEAARIKAVADEFTEWLVALDEEHHRHTASLQALVSAAISHAAQQCRHAATARTTASAELALAEGCRCHDAATQLAMSAAPSSIADELHRHKAAAQAAESTVLLLAEERRQHKATELATMSAMRSLAASQDRANIEATAYVAPALPTTTSPESLAMLSPSPCRTSSYLGAVLNTNGGGHLSLHLMLPTVAAPTSLSVVKDQPLWIATAPDLVVALDVATVLALPAL